MNPLNNIPKKEITASAFTYKAPLCLCPKKAIIKITGYTASAIHGNEIPNTCESGWRSTSVQAKVDEKSQNDVSPTGSTNLTKYAL